MKAVTHNYCNYKVKLLVLITKTGDECFRCLLPKCNFLEKGSLKTNFFKQTVQPRMLMTCGRGGGGGGGGGEGGDV